MYPASGSLCFSKKRSRGDTEKMSKTVRPRMLPIEIQTLHDAISCLINKMKELLESNPGDHELAWNLVCARRMRFRLVRIQCNKIGSAPRQVMLEALLPLDTKDPEYVRGLLAMGLVPKIPYVQEHPMRLFTVLVDAAMADAIRGYKDVEDGWQFAKEDVMLMARYLKEFRST